MLKNYFKTHEDVRKKCMDDMDVDKKLEEIFEDGAEIQYGEKLKCYMKCLLIVSGATNEYLEPNPENIKRNMQLKDVSVAKDLIKQCSGYDKVDLCNGAEEFVECGLTYLETHI